MMGRSRSPAFLTSVRNSKPVMSGRPRSRTRQSKRPPLRAASPSAALAAAVISTPSFPISSIKLSRWTALSSTRRSFFGGLVDELPQAEEARLQVLSVGGLHEDPHRSLPEGPFALLDGGDDLHRDVPRGGVLLEPAAHL